MYNIELKYTPRRCKALCCGDCIVDKNNKSCGQDIDTCLQGFLYTFILRPLEDLRRRANSVCNKG